MSKKLLLSFAILVSSLLLAEDDIDADLGGFDTQEEEVVVEEMADDLAGFGDEEIGSELDGFGDDDIIISETQTQEEPQEKPNNFTLSGDLAFKSAYGYREHRVGGIDYEGFNQAQTSLFLQFDAQLSDNWKFRISGDAFYDAVYALHLDNEYNSDVLDTYETQLRFNDTYIQGRLSSDIDLKVGRQIVVWGKSDSIRVTDVINPTDNCLPGMTDIEDLRLSTTMAKLDYYIGAWNLSAMAIAESRVFIEAAPRGEFFPVDNIFLSAPDPFIELEKPEISWDNMQYAFAANGIFSGWDLSVYVANVFDQKWHIDPNIGKRVVSKIDMLGSAINIATGSWLIKSEVAYIDGVKYNSTRDAKSRLDALIGFDYMGISDTVLSLEVANKHIFNYETQMSKIVPSPDYIYRDEMQTAIRATRSFENDSINTSILLSMFGQEWQYGGFARIWVEYDIMDALSANFGIVDYIAPTEDSNKPFMKAIKDNDRIFADITYSF